MLVQEKQGDLHIQEKTLLAPQQGLGRGPGDVGRGTTSQIFNSISYMRELHAAEVWERRAFVTCSKSKEDHRVPEDDERAPAATAGTL